MVTISASILNNADDTKRKQLRTSIQRKRKKLMQLTARFHTLKIELELIQHEYTIRIGRLYLKDNQLDFEIIRLKNILHLMLSGKSYFEAEAELEEEFLPDNEAFSKCEEEINKKKMNFFHFDVGEDMKKEIKKLWKTLIVKYHPDLTMNLADKKTREEYMKKINAAYAANDLDSLKKLRHDVTVSYQTESLLEDLENILVAIESTIQKIEYDYIELCQSEWYGWRARVRQARRRKEDVFKKLENKLLDDIVKKITVAQRLRQQVQQREDQL